MGEHWWGRPPWHLRPLWRSLNLQRLRCVCTATVAWHLHQEKATVEQSSNEFSPWIGPKECGRGQLVEDSLVDDTSSYCAIGRNNVWPNVTRRTSPQTGASTLSSVSSRPWEVCKGREEHKHRTKYCQMLDNPTQSSSKLRLWRRFFSQRDNDPKRCAKAPQNGWKTTRWKTWS